MGKFRFYLSPAKEQINFGYPFDSATMDAPFYPEIEITDYLQEDSFTSIDESLDDPKHLGGVLSYSNFKMEINNEKKLFAVGAAPKIFPYKQKGSKLRIEWDDGPEYPICGAAKTICGDFYLIRSKRIYEGIIFDDPLEKDSDLKILQYQVLGYLSLLKESGKFSFQTAHQNTHSVIFQIFIPLLERGIIKEETGLPNLSNNLVAYTDWPRDHDQPGVILVTPPIAGEKNLKDLLNDMLGICGGYIFFEENTYLFRNVVFDPVRPDFQFECHNQNSNEGIENIQDPEIKPEFDRIYSEIVWTNDQPYGTTAPNYHSVPAADPKLFGINPYEIDFFEYVTTVAEADKVLNNLKLEFSDLKKGFKIPAPLTIEALEPKFLESIKLFIPPRGKTVRASDNISDGEVYPIILLGKKIDMKKEQIIFYCRWSALWA